MRWVGLMFTLVLLLIPWHAWGEETPGPFVFADDGQLLLHPTDLNQGHESRPSTTLPAPWYSTYLGPLRSLDGVLSSEKIAA
jgi:hypothetical protein